MPMRTALAIIVLLASTPAFAADPTLGSGDGGRSAKMICKSQTQIGSRLGTKRICKTKAEWDDLRQQSRQVMDRLQGQGNPPCRLPGMGGGCSSDGL
jgi:hypothetical protein